MLQLLTRVIVQAAMPVSHQPDDQGTLATGAVQASHGGILLTVVHIIVDWLSRSHATVRAPGIAGVDDLLQLPVC
jgi:hypothetical protein